MTAMEPVLRGFWSTPEGEAPPEIPSEPALPTSEDLKRYTWYQLAQEWMRKRNIAPDGQTPVKVTIRGDIENQYILHLANNIL